MASAFVEFVKNAEKLGKKKGRLPILSASKFFPFKEERELISLVRNEFERAMNANIELAFNGETFADSLEEMNSNESTLPSTFVEKSRTIANSVDSNARSSFSKQSEMIIGHPYFPPENARQIVETWHSNFLELCKSAENDTKAEISRIVATGKMQGWNKKQVETAVKERLPAKTKHRAELIARTELGKLNSSVNMETMKSVGIRYYKWLSTLDTRCRSSHAAMNNVICSLDDPTVYFEDNPENGAKPIKHNRTSTMVKLHPGFDFQCRCSMVMWEPEIDSKYEVKEESIAEPSQISQEKSVIEQKLEKAEERAIKAEKEVEQLKNEQIRLLSRQRLEKAAEKRHARSAEEIADIQRRWDERKSRRRLKEAAEYRHSKRTSEEIKSIYSEWQKRVDIRQFASKLLVEANGIKGLPEISKLERALEKGNKKAYKEMKVLSKNLEISIDTLKRCTYLADPIQAARDFDYSTAITVNESVRKKLEGMSRTLDGKKHAIEFEIEWVEKHKKYASWKVAQDAYKKALAEVERLIDWETELGRVDSIKMFLKNHPKSALLKKLTNEMDVLIAKGDNDSKKEIKELLKKAEKRRKEIEYREGFKRLKKLKSSLKNGSDIPFSTNISIDDLRALKGDKLPPTLSHLDTAIDKYKKDGYYYGAATKKHAAEIETTMRELFKKHDLGMHINHDLLDKVFNSHFKNTFETGSSGGYLGPKLNPDGSIKQSHARLSAAHKLFDLGSTEKANQLNISQYEKYGNLLDHDKLREATTYNRATQYGNVAVRFKKDKVICTWTAGDSLGKRYQPSLVTDPKAVSYDDMRESKLPVKGTQTNDMTKFRDDNIISYLELQFHGDVTIDCVESLTFPYDLTEKAKSKYLGFAQKWKSIGTEIYFIKNGKLEKL